MGLTDHVTGKGRLPDEERARGYRVYIRPPVIERIERMADAIGIDAKRLVGVWLSEVAFRKEAELNMTRNLTDVIGAELGSLMAADLKRRDGEDTT